MDDKTIIEEPVLVQVALRREISRSPQSRYEHRLHAVLLVSNGRSAREVAALLHENPRTIQRWVERFRRDGLDGLREGERTGRPSALAAGDWESLKLDLQRAPAEFGFERERWDAACLASHVGARYGASFSLRHCQRILRGFSAKFSR